MTPEDEQHWVEEARRHPEKFGQLYDYYFPKLYAYVNHRVTRSQDAEDIVAETFLKAVGAIKNFEWQHNNSLAAWLFRIAHNLISNFYRQHRVWGESLPLEEANELQATAPMPEDVVLQKELFEQLRGYIGTLSARRQDVITLKFFGQLRNCEIAEVLGLDERTVASHLCRGLEELYRRYNSPASQNERGRGVKERTRAIQYEQA